MKQKLTKGLAILLSAVMLVPSAQTVLADAQTVPEDTAVVSEEAGDALDADRSGHCIW